MSREYSTFSSALSQQGLSENTISIYVSLINEFKEWKTEHPELDDGLYVLDLLKSEARSISSINNKIAAINKYYSVYSPAKKFLPYINFKVSCKKINLDDKFIRNLFRNISKDRDRLAFYLILYAGLGFNELRDLTLSDVDLWNGCIYVGNINIPMHNELATFLEVYLSKYAFKKQHLFYYRGPLSSSGLYRMLSRYNTDDIKLTPTCLQRTFFKKLYDTGVSLDIIYCLHSLKPEYYNLLDYEEIKNAINKISW